MQPATDKPAPPARLVTGSTLRHVVTMTAASAFGLVSVFAVEALSLLYVALLGQPELTAALGYASTLLFFATSVSIGLSIAASALTSRALGRGNRHQASEFAGAALALMVVVMTLFALLALPMLRPLIRLLGATGHTADVTHSLLLIVLPSWPLLGAGMCLSGLLRALGDAPRAMYVTLGSAAATIVFDPLLIFGFGLGVQGAAWSTVLARAVMVLVGLHGLLRVHGLFARPRMATCCASSSRSWPSACRRC